ncbi:phage tail tape measure protein [Glaciimonas sp. PAMC28666]|uniref:phage tail tape measure protein n=1 Tax=Glaciimonas sp. PAMC28666 TaxID=2807626 RepID=UPI001964133E|nr:phage tail tape measure protein [Glaciimonas sp. PAMC28666]QRX82253.1 phage tail tape measure protein [Glaciimonas sp. PAMC28666]
MSDSVIGRGVIEVVADATKLKAGIDDAKRSIHSLGETNKATSAKASASIDRYVQKLGHQNAMLNMSAREMALYKLSVRGASDAQLSAADSALKLNEAHQRSENVSKNLKVGFIAVAAAAVATTTAIVALTGRIIEQITSYQGLGEKMGDTAVNIASLKLASELSGVALNTVATASVKLTDALSKTNDSTKGAGSAITALGLNYQQFKALSPVEQLDAVANAMAGFADGSEKTAVAVALFGRAGADLIPFLNDLADKGQRYTTLTAAQIAAADDLAKANVILKSSFNDMAVAMIADSIPALTSLQSVFLDLTKDQMFMSIASDILNKALETGIGIFKHLTIAATEVGFVFLGVGREIAAVSAQLVTLAHGDLSGFRAISNAVKADGERARRELDRFQAKVLSIGQTAPAGSTRETQAPTDDRQKINISGLAGEDAARKKAGNNNAASQAAKVQLAFDLAQIDKQSNAIVNTYANAEKIMQAHRAAGLIDERDYYASKLAFLHLNTEAQQSALEKEIARMQAENLHGKDRLDNDRKISDAQTKLAKVREDAIVSVQILSIQEVSALNNVAQSYRDAEDAAQDYLDTIRTSQTREIAGMGLGSIERERTTGRAHIEDKYSAQRQDVDNSRRDAEMSGTFGPDAQKKYTEELARIQRFQATALTEYDAYFAQRLQQEGDWSVGASAALQNYVDASRNMAAQTEDLFANAFQGMEDALTTFITTGKLSFKGLASSIIADLARIESKKILTSLIGGSSSGNGWVSAAMGLIGAASGSSQGGSAMAAMDGANGFNLNDGFASAVRGQRAIGGPVSSGGIYEVNEKGPELLHVAGRQYLMMGGESGSVSPNAEASTSSGAPTPTIIVNILGGAAPDVRRAAGQGAREGLAAFQHAQRYV